MNLKQFISIVWSNLYKISKILTKDIIKWIYSKSMTFMYNLIVNSKIYLFHISNQNFVEIRCTESQN